MTPREWAAQQVMIRIVVGWVKLADAAGRAELEQVLAPEEAVAAVLPDGTPIGRVSRTVSAKSARVTDERALLAWVREHRPDELVQSVRASFVEHCKKQAKDHGQAFDPTSGEVIPGVELVEGSSAYRVTPNPDAEHVARARLGDVRRLLELPGAES